MAHSTTASENQNNPCFSGASTEEPRGGDKVPVASKVLRTLVLDRRQMLMFRCPADLKDLLPPGPASYVCTQGDAPQAFNGLNLREEDTVKRCRRSSVR